MSAGVASLQALLDEGASSGVFPSGQAMVLREGEVVFEGHAGEAGPGTIFDVASLTKVLSTTALMARAWGQGVLTPERPLSDWFPNAFVAQAGATLEDLLFHRAGYPASKMLWADAIRGTPELLHEDCPGEVRRSVRGQVIDAALRVELVQPIRESAVYCDVGFIVLGEVLERAAGKPLDALFTTELAEHLGLSLGYRRLSQRLPATNIAPTGRTRPRELAPEQQPPPGPVVPQGPTRLGEVDDDNAWTLDGVAGHAGIFGTTRAVAQFGEFLLEEWQGAGRVAPAWVWQRMFQRDPLLPQSTRAMGFDTPSAEGSSVGRHFGRGGPLGAVGHLGFTGVSLWLDLDRKWVVALMTNRSYLGRHVTKIREFRPRFHEAVAAVLTE